MKRILAIGLVLLSGCAAQIEHKMKTVVLLSPESSGKGKVAFGAGYQSAPMVTITRNVLVIPPDRSLPRIDQQERIMFHGGIGISDRVDLNLDPASWLNAKFQVIGEPLSRAETGNISASVLGSLWFENDRGEGDRLNSSNLPDETYLKRAFSWRLGAIGGYRLSDMVLLYTGLNRQEHRYHGTFDIRGGAKGSYAGFASANSANLGIEMSFSKRFVVRLEDAYSIAKIPAYNAKSSQHSIGLLLAGMLGGSEE